MINILLNKTLAFTIHGEIQKVHSKIMNLKPQHRHETKSFNYLMDDILYQIFKIIFNISKKTRGSYDNPSKRIYVNKIENRIAFKIKAGYCLELLTPETMNLFGSNKIKIN